MKSNDIITILISSGALIVSFITLWWNHSWKKYENHLLKKKIFRESWNNFNNQLNDTYLNNSTKINFEKNKSSLILLFDLTKEKIIEEKNFVESIFYCKKCLNFYKSSAIKLMHAIVSLPEYGQSQINNFFNEKYCSESSLKEKKYFLYESLFSFSIDLFYLKKSLKEFIIVDTIFFDINNFDFENRIIKFLLKRKWLRILLLKIWLLKKWFKKFLLSRKPKLHDEYKKYIDNFIKVLSNQKYYQKLEIFNPIKAEKNLLDIKEAMEFFKIHLPLVDKEILKKKKKIVFSISKCHFCIFENLGFYSLTKDKLSKILNNTN